MEECETDITTMPGTSSTNSRLGMCEVCSCNPAKYACPKCEVKTCSLRCVKIHKQELECDGTRDKTKYIPLNKFTNLDLSSDYRLLEELTRNVISLKRNPARKFTRKNGELPKHLFKLRTAASSRKTILKFLPRNFARHKRNTTYLNFKSNVVFWHIDWIFVNADNLKLSDDNVPETAKLSNLLHKYMVLQEDKTVQQKLQYYQAVDLPGIKLYLKAEEKAGCKFYELDPLRNLKDNLKNKIIIEYPIIHIVLKEHSSSYDILDSDDDENMDVETLNGKQVVDQIIKKAEKEESLDNSLKNLLFVSELSDEEISDEA
ncbi:hypothetical protein ILUMI_11822 [Ignelater luminosus]|uniref:Box C/D snoRNA protein 1 n=1 Tax=Ignelater luminosus TaxID=2038154 RepID=A0A8K0GCD2_IGNLU|nr:hypothetical protein ILUMI_11822 [Ignelater luminosus]